MKRTFFALAGLLVASGAAHAQDDEDADLFADDADLFAEDDALFADAADELDAAEGALAGSGGSDAADGPDEAPPTPAETKPQAGGNETPGPAAALVLGGLAVAALALRRRA